MRYLITFSYDGSKFFGYQKQKEEETIQETLEQALTKINKKEVHVVGSGRTDAKVHANMQCAHFDLDINIEPENLKKGINSLIGDYIYVYKVEQVDNNFHARFNVLKKTYTYKLNMGEYNPIEADYVYQLNKQLDINKMIEASNYLIGEHNFKSFTKADDIKESYIRTIYDLNIKEPNNYLTISFTGNGFMRYMVRNMVGSLIEVGLLKKQPQDIKTILEQEDRTKAGITAPACGLYLDNIEY